MILTPQAVTAATATARAVANIAALSSKPVLAAWMGGRSLQRGRRGVRVAGSAHLQDSGQGRSGLLHLVSYARNLSLLHETPRDFPWSSGWIAANGGRLSRPVDRRRRHSFGGPVQGPAGIVRNPRHPTRCRGYGRRSRDIAEQLGYPVVVKIDSPQISHKTEVGGVVLNLPDAAAVREAYEQVVRRAVEMRPDAQIAGVTVQKMIAWPSGFELILGTKKDPVFGPVIMVGMGGVAAEVFQDRALGLPPLNDVLARRMLESLKSWPLLRGYRGRPGANIDRLIEIIMRFSYLVADYPEIEELDINPLLVTPVDAIALDARVVVDRRRPGNPPAGGEVARMPICYPALSRRVCTHRTLKDGAEVIFRPIKPEDEPLWHELLATCSTQSRWFRFNYLFKQTTHDMASRYCYIDYDRELAIVAEVEEQGQRRLVGIGRLVADVDHQSAEYAVIVTDRWQGRGLGGLLTDYCLELAQSWGVKEVVAEIAKDNSRMLATFRNRGFEITSPLGQDVAIATRRPQ